MSLKKVDPKYFEDPEKYIPKGPYCSRGEYRCPFWDLDESKPAQYNGYCHYLKKGDVDIAKESVLIDQDGNEWNGVEVPFPVGLLWDGCKECGINEGYEEIDEGDKSNDD